LQGILIGKEKDGYSGDWLMARSDVCASKLNRVVAEESFQKSESK
jgi:hypothetical protein